MEEAKSVLITGACGFLGQATTELFLKHGYVVTVLDLHSVVQELPTELAKNPRLRTLAVDLVNDDFQSQLPSRIDFVVHLAGLTSVKESFEQPNKYERVNIGGTKTLLNALKDRKIQKFIFPSSASVYGVESTDNTDENTPLNPKSPYARGKVIAEQSVAHQGKTFDFKTVVLRFFNIYGPGQKFDDSGIVSIFIRSMIEHGNIVIIGDGSRTRSFIHVQDCARAILLSCTATTGDNAIINVCGEKSTTIKELAETLIQSSGRDDIVIEYKPNDDQLVMKSGCSGKVAMTLLGFTPQVPLAEGLGETYRFFSSFSLK
jgi:UDP-glucose 4-epimerase